MIYNVGSHNWLYRLFLVYLFFSFCVLYISLVIVKPCTVRSLAVKQFSADRLSVRSGSTMYVLYSYVVVDWWSVMQLGRKRARGNSLVWSVLGLISICTHSF